MKWQSREAYNEYMRNYLTNRRVEYRQWIADLKSQSGCVKCNEDDPRCLDFHHVNPADKEFSIAGAVGRSTFNRDKILAEISKCEVLCANCHRKLHGFVG